MRKNLRASCVVSAVECAHEFNPGETGGDDRAACAGFAQRIAICARTKSVGHRQRRRLPRNPIGDCIAGVAGDFVRKQHAKKRVFAACVRAIKIGECEGGIDAGGIAGSFTVTVTAEFVVTFGVTNSTGVTFTVAISEKNVSVTVTAATIVTATVASVVGGVHDTARMRKI